MVDFLISYINIFCLLFLAVISLERVHVSAMFKVIKGKCWRLDEKCL